MNYASFTRVTWIDKQIQMGKLTSVHQIAEAFEVSLRTAERDLQKMRTDLGAAVKFNKTKGVYEYVGNPMTLPAQWLNKEEISLILIAEKALRSYTQASYEEKIHPAFNQFLNPIRQHEEEMQYVRDMCNAVHFYHPYTPTRAVGKEFAEVLSAILANKKIRFKYTHSGTIDSWRIVSPYLILNNNGLWQVIGLEQSSRKIKTFALDTCSHVKTINEYFAKPHDFDASAYYSHPFELLVKKPFETITLFIKKPLSEQIRSITWHPSQQVEDVQGEGVRVTFTCHRTMYFEQWCRSMDAVEVHP